MELESQSIVSDFLKLAILNGLSLAFHGTCLKAYMDKAFNGNISACRLTLCKCHTMHTSARKARLCYGNNKEGRCNFLVLCSRMMHSTSQDDLDAVFRDVCTMSKSMTDRVVAVFSGARI